MNHTRTGKLSKLWCLKHAGKILHCFVNIQTSVSSFIVNMIWNIWITYPWLRDSNAEGALLRTRIAIICIIDDYTCQNCLLSMKGQQSSMVACWLALNWPTWPGWLITASYLRFDQGTIDSCWMKTALFEDCPAHSGDWSSFSTASGDFLNGTFNL